MSSTRITLKEIVPNKYDNPMSRVREYDCERYELSQGFLIMWNVMELPNGNPNARIIQLVIPGHKMDWLMVE